MKSLHIVTLLSVAISGCASTANSYKTPAPKQAVTGNESLAMQVMRASGRDQGLRDIEVGSAVNLDQSSVIMAADAALAYRFSQGFESPPPGFSGEAMSAFFILSMLNDQTIHTRQSTWVEAWMPKAPGEDVQSAKVRFSKILEDASIRALPEGYQVKSFEWVDKAIFGAESSYKVLRVDGPLCESWSCILGGAYVSSREPSKDFTVRLKATISPSFVVDRGRDSFSPESYNAPVLKKVFKEYLEEGKINGQWYRIESEVLPGFDHAGFVRRFSAELPDWAYVYSGPKSPLNDRSVPVVMSGSEELYFVRRVLD